MHEHDEGRPGIRQLRERVEAAIHGDVRAVASVLMAWSGKLTDIEMENGRTLIRCPVPGHEDENPSCSVYRAKNGRVLFRCRACGGFGDLITAHQLIFGTDVERALTAAGGAFGILFVAGPAPAHTDTALIEVIAAASDVYGVSADLIVSGSRSRRHVEARHAAMYVARESTGLSYPVIASAFGRRDHTTVLHAVRKIERLLAERDEGRQRVLAVKALIDHESRAEGLRRPDQSLRCAV